MAPRTTPAAEQSPDPWRLGGIGEKTACRWLGISESLFRRLAKQEGWPRKRIKKTTRIVYPRALVREFLRDCEAA